MLTRRANFSSFFPLKAEVAVAGTCPGQAKPPAVPAGGFFGGLLETSQTIRIRSYAEREAPGKPRPGP